MQITILNKEYNVNIKKLDLGLYQLQSLPTEIGNLINLEKLYLRDNKLQSLPIEIGNLCNLKKSCLYYNKLQSLPIEILKIKNTLEIDDSSYDIDNLNINNKILIFSNLKDKLNNLPINRKEIWLKSNIKNYDIKITF